MPLPRTLGVVLRSGRASHAFSLSRRDVALLDQPYFFADPALHFRAVFGLDLSAPKRGVVLVTHRREALEASLATLLRAIEARRDLLGFDYDWEYAADPEMGEAMHVNGFHALVHTEPAGACFLTLSEPVPGKGAKGARVVQIVDMRVTPSVTTDEGGVLRAFAKRRAEVGWLRTLPRAIAWVKKRSGDVDVSHE